MDGGHLNQKPKPKPIGGMAMKKTQAEKIRDSVFADLEDVPDFVEDSGKYLVGLRLGADAGGRLIVERFDFYSGKFHPVAQDWKNFIEDSKSYKIRLENYMQLFILLKKENERIAELLRKNITAEVKEPVSENV
jgi:hypothetical protein